ncbi:hypothetical protein PHLGIDRAFT_15285 [Phlebiopsis gigantea 11061_1 CR5-6]|uniref:Uncharacterized protein n=1 Tax=Phlebiopsis gigantea (strain 11061_1 CR5-6) TaxID=745531 RepID=A0A0C3S3B4_PHLG1|nr:hypothetical protein PHLGIDRAFT_15285 [Phlebiopsis gigantea 11061_1 CR5-6]
MTRVCAGTHRLVPSFVASLVVSFALPDKSEAGDEEEDIDENSQVFARHKTRMRTHLWAYIRVDEADKSSSESASSEERLLNDSTRSQMPSRSSATFEFTFTYPLALVVEGVAQLSMGEPDDPDPQADLGRSDSRTDVMWETYAIVANAGVTCYDELGGLCICDLF